MKKFFFSSCFFMMLGAVGCNKPDSGAAAAQQKATALKIESAPVELRKMPRYLTLTGSIQADSQSSLAANVAGRITATYVERGQPVKKGQAMVAVDAKAASLQAAAATAQSQAAEAQVEQARLDCLRADTLFQKGVLPQSEYDRQKTSCTAQLYNANAARAQADLAGKLASDTVIRSPLDGIVGERFVSVGEYVTASSKVATVFAIQSLRVLISVPEAAVGLVRDGQLLTLEVAAYPDREFPAVVHFVSPALRERTRDLLVEALAPNDDRALRPGMFAKVNLLISEEEQAAVPEEALKSDSTVHRVFVVKDGVAHEQVVTLGVKKEGFVAIASDIHSGEQVVLRPPADLRDGMTVQ